jgi:hypothetical protein
LTASRAKVIARSTVQHITAPEQLHESIARRLKDFQEQLNERLDDAGFVIDNVFDNENVLQDEDLNVDPAYGDGSKTPTDEEYRMHTKPPERPDEDEIESEAYDKYIGAEMLVDFGVEGQKRATVKQRVRDFDGNLFGKSHKNPMLDTTEYVIEYEDGTSDRMFANTITESIYTQVNDEGRQFVLLKEITDHRKNSEAIKMADGFVTMPNGRKARK